MLKNHSTVGFGCGVRPSSEGRFFLCREGYRRWIALVAEVFNVALL